MEIINTKITCNQCEKCVYENNNHSKDNVLSSPFPPYLEITITSKLCLSGDMGPIYLHFCNSICVNKYFSEKNK